jgi:hypothetical protein
MTLPIPAGLLPVPTGEVRRPSDTIAPSAPVGISGIAALDPRLVLRMPEPVVTADQSSLTRQALERNFQESLPAISPPHEPSVMQAALIEISSNVTNLLPKQLDLITTDFNSPYPSDSLMGQLDSQISPNSESQTTDNNSLNHLPVGQAVASSELNTINKLIGDILSKQISNQSISTNTVPHFVTNEVLWPGLNANKQNEQMTNTLLANDPKAVLNSLRENLKISGLFASEQLSTLLTNNSMPSKGSPEISDTSPSNETSSLLKIQKLMQQLDLNSSTIVDSIKLALKGQIYWEGMLTNNLPAKMKREDAWATNPKDDSKIIKGTRISVEINLPKLGVLTIVGTQFQDQLYLNILSKDLTTSNFFKEKLYALETSLLEQKIDLTVIQFGGL